MSNEILNSLLREYEQKKVNAELDVGSDEEKIQKDGKNRQEEQRICL